MFLEQSARSGSVAIWCDLLLRLLLYLSFRIITKRPSPRRRFPSSADLFRASSVLGFQKQTIQHPTYQFIKATKPHHTNQPGLALEREAPFNCRNYMPTKRTTEC